MSWHTYASPGLKELTHWGRVTHICVSKLIIIGSDNGLSPGRRQAIIWTNVGILLSGPLGTNFSEILTGIETFSFTKMHLKMSSAKWRPFCLCLNVLRCQATGSSLWNMLLQMTWYPMALGHIDGLAQDCGNSSASAMELPQSCAKPSINSTDLITLVVSISRG